MALRFPFLETATVAHRGAHCCGRQENSLSAIAHAVELSVPGIEIDVCNLSDGELVLSHDPYVTLAGATVPLPALTVPDLMPRLRTGELVLARRALELVRSTDAFLCLDWKGYGYEARIGQLIHELGLTERTIVCSHSSETLARIKGERRDLLTGLSFPGTQGLEVVDRVQAARADAAMLERGLASPALLGSLRERGTGVFVWTAKDAETSPPSPTSLRTASCRTYWTSTGAQSPVPHEPLGVARRRDGRRNPLGGCHDCAKQR